MILSRRHFLKYGALGLAGGVLLPFSGATGALAAERPAALPLATAQVFNVREYGAVGDGVADDYAALQRAVAAVNRARGGTLLFPPGIYRIGRYKIGGPGGNGVADLVLRDCAGLLVSGYGATLDVRGDFRRTADRTLAGPLASYRDSVSLVFLRCRGFAVEGLTLDGNVDRMTRDAGVVEQGEHGGIRTAGCADYTLRDLHCHHWQTDGIILGTTDDLAAPLVADRDARLENVRCANNARQGLSIIQLAGGTITDSVFEAGRTGGAYGYHEPAAGVDIEPIFSPTTATRIDAKTGELRFDRCTFRDNLRSQFMAWGDGTTIGALTLQNCTVEKGAAQNIATLSLQAERTIVDSCTMTVDRIFTTSGTSATTWTRLVNCDIRCDGNVIWDSGLGTTVIEGCRLIGTHTRPATGMFLFLQRPTTVLRNNAISIPAAAATSGKRTGIVNLANIALAQGNRYTTDLQPGTATQFLLNFQKTPTAGESFADPLVSAGPLVLATGV